MLAYTGLETVANYAEEARRPGRDLPRSALQRDLARRRHLRPDRARRPLGVPAAGGTTALGTDWLRAPLMGIVVALQTDLPNWFGDALRVYVGLTGALILLAAAITTSISGFGRLAYSLGEHGQLPAVFGRLHRRTLVSPASVVAAAAIAIALLSAPRSRDSVPFLASLFSFGVLLAFTAAQLAVIRLADHSPTWRGPFRVPLNVRVRGVGGAAPGRLRRRLHGGRRS